jgi:hypothetical protein
VTSAGERLLEGAREAVAIARGEAEPASITVFWTEIESSNLKAASYIPDGEHLVVRFHSGAAVVYDGVPKAEFEALVGAESAGRYFHANIRSVYPVSKAEVDEAGCITAPPARGDEERPLSPRDLEEQA